MSTTEDTFGYNYAGESTGASYGNGARTVTYGLDDAGNRTLVTDSVYGTAGFTPNSLNQYLETTNGSQHEIASAYYVNYHYLGDTQLASASRSSSDKYELGYDALGRCVRSRTKGQTIYYIYDGSRAIVEYNPGDGSSPTRNVYGLGIDEIIMRNSFDHPRFLQQDRLGSTSAVLDDLTGAVVEQYRYDAFGAPEVRTGPAGGNPLGTVSNTGTLVNNRYLFTGREWVQRYDFYEYRARAYNPALGRFMSEDPIGFGGGDTNLFRYCGNDPVNFVDPSGLSTFQLGLSFTGQIGPVTVNFNSGFVIDSHGNFGVYNTSLLGAGAGGRASAGISVESSNADQIVDLREYFTNVSVGGYAGGGASGDGFSGRSTRTGQLIGGLGATFGVGLGGGGSLGRSYTYITPLFSHPPSNNPPPGGSTYDSGCGGDPNCAETERITVVGAPLTFASTAGFGGGGTFDFAPGGGGRISEVILSRLNPLDGEIGGFPSTSALTYIDASRAAGGGGGIGVSAGFLIP
ncbi:MAG: RHS repeat-associated core domain-containing protein [Chthoniobacterales bacterium]